MAVQGQYLVLMGIVLLFLGLLLIFIGSFIGFREGSGKVEGGGVILIGPIPIIFGTSSKAAVLAAALAVVIMILAIIFYMVQRSGLS
ncbi:MAG: DUF131 domain-containing protein [Desulfurococcales archaeon]|nr:DUF131 domain-containing protein [Desulfurococcales archaeon]